MLAAPTVYNSLPAFSPFGAHASKEDKVEILEGGVSVVNKVKERVKVVFSQKLTKELGEPSYHVVVDGRRVVFHCHPSFLKKSNGPRDLFIRSLSIRIEPYDSGRIKITERNKFQEIILIIGSNSRSKIVVFPDSHEIRLLDPKEIDS